MASLIYFETNNKKHIQPKDYYKVHITTTNRDTYFIILQTKILEKSKCFICEKKLSSIPNRQNILAFEKRIFYRLADYIMQKNTKRDISNILAHSLFANNEQPFVYVIIHEKECLEKIIKILNTIHD